MNGWSLLAPFSLLYGAGVGLRNFAYDHGLFRTRKTSATVLSVGNITAGGSGKTPLTVHFARTLKELAPDLPLAIVSRGYGRRSRGVRVVADRHAVLLDPVEGGDEPVMMARSLPGVPVVVAEKRVQGVEHAVKRFGAELVLLDDAFQHRQIARDLNVVLLDGSAPDWTWRLLPAGRMRETSSALGRADLVVLTGSPAANRAEQMIRWMGDSNTPDIAMGGPVPQALRPVEGGREIPLEWLRDTQVAAVCAIARPERFFATVEALGASLVLKEGWRDHAWTTPEQRERVLCQAVDAGAEALVITAKDAVKWPLEATPLPVWVLEVGWSWQDGHAVVMENLRGFVEAARTPQRLHK